jgi:RNA polymerase sigma factor (sigma-70 family)
LMAAPAMADTKKGLVERLYAEHYDALRTFFYRRIRARYDAADLAQEVYVRMLQRSDTEGIRNPEAYLYTVASNLVKEHAVLDLRQANAVDVDDASVQELLGELPTLDGQLDTNRRMLRLRTVLEQLSPKCRAVVILRYQYELSYQEIAERLGVSSNMVKKYLAHALGHCQCRMAPGMRP